MLSSISPQRKICDYHLPDDVLEYLYYHQGWMHFETGLIFYSASTGTREWTPVEKTVPGLLAVIENPAKSHLLNIAGHEQYWWPFFGLFMVQFLATGVANGSTFRTIPNIFDKKKAGPVLGWTAAVGAYGSFVIPRVIGEQVELGQAEFAMYGFAAYYAICLALNWWYYLGPKREFESP